MSSTAHGYFAWHDLITTDIPSAVEFYKKVIGWQTQPFEPAGTYLMWTGKHGTVGGVGPAPEAVTPYWRVYIGTDDINATIVKALQLGGKVTMPVADIPNVGKWASLQDPQGNEFGLFWSADSKTPELHRDPGEFNWHELVTDDHEAAFKFYQQLFGWQHGIDHNIGEMGVYSVFTHEGRPQGMGGMYNRANGVPSGWRTYTIVKDASKAASTIKRLGGVVTQAAEQVPGGSWIVKFTDPQGASHALTALENSAVTKTAVVENKVVAADNEVKPARKKVSAIKKKSAPIKRKKAVASKTTKLVKQAKVKQAVKSAKPKTKSKPEVKPAKKIELSEKEIKKQKKKEKKKKKKEKKAAKKLKKQLKKLRKQEKKARKKEEKQMQRKNSSQHKK